MSKKEYLPILKDGFKEIGLWELDNYFLNPFGEDNHQRKYLINRLQEYLNDFSSIGIEAEVWIDGSFTTFKPEPVDIDVAFLLDKNIIDKLPDRKAIIFEELLMDRSHVLARYSCDVYLVDRSSEEEINEWIKTFGTDYNNINSKGIFKLMLRPNA